MPYASGVFTDLIVKDPKLLGVLVVKEFLEFDWEVLAAFVVVKALFILLFCVGKSEMDGQ